MRNKKPKPQCLNEAMGYYYLVSGTDTTTPPKFKTPSMISFCHMIGEAATKFSLAFGM